MIKKGLLFVLILLCLLIISPVVAYPLLIESNATNSANIGYGTYWDIRYMDIHQFSNINEISGLMSKHLWTAPTPLAGSYFGTAKYYANNSANYLFTWSVPNYGAPAGYMTGSYSIVFSNMTPITDYGEKNIHLENLREYLMTGGGQAQLASSPGALSPLLAYFLDGDTSRVLLYTDSGTRVSNTLSRSYGYKYGVPNSSTGNLIVNVKANSTGVNLAGALVTFNRPNQSYSSLTDSYGNATFPNLWTNGTSEAVYTTLDNYNPDMSYKQITDTTNFLQVYLMPLSGIGVYYITVSPAWIPSDGTQYLYGQIHKEGYSGTNLTEFNTLSWSWHKIGTNGNPDGLETPYIETTNSSNHLTYSRTTDIYKGWSSISNAFSNVKTGALPNPLSLNPIGATGSILTTLLATDTSGNNYKLSVSNLIGDNTTTPNNVKFIVQDAYTGYRVYPSQLSVRNDATGVWWNVSTQYGEYEFILPVGAHVTEFASANGYTNVTNNIVIEANMIRYVNMYPSSFLGTPDKSELLIYVRSSPTGGFSSQPLEDSYVSITQVNNSIVKSDYTSATGIVSFSVNKSTAYTITASKTGYTSGTQTINTAFINPYEAYIYLTNLNVISPTITPTPFITVTPVPTVIGGAVRNLTASTCGVPTGSMTIVEIFKQNIACWGVETREAQDLVLAGIIIAFFAFVLSKWGKGLGALIGGSIGFILSLAAGLIPVWAFFALVIIAGLIFGLKLYSGGK